MGLLAALEGQGSASKGMWGHKSYVMKFLADFVPDTFENHRFAAVHRGKGHAGTQVLSHEIFLADFVLETFEKVLAGGRRVGQSSASKGADASLFEVRGKYCF